MFRYFALVFGALCYLLSSAVLAYYLCWLGGFLVPKTIDSGTIDSGTIDSGAAALLINALLVALFVVPHSMLARPRFKVWWTRIVPAPIQRSVYLLHATLAIALMMAAWQALPAPLWQVDHPLAQALLWGGFALGWIFMLGGAFSIDHLELMGLKQVAYNFLGAPLPAQPFSVRWFYSVVRHPIALGHLLVVWCHPQMSLGHAYYATLATIYVFYATYRLEEPDLDQAFGETYAAYRKRVPGLVPLGTMLSPRRDRPRL
ncbi:MAG TPA: isoprenylcysteine carboxylmethyltransferase family protein [Kiloniellaceae bacterium]|nr:isoprenylcysteine carboxylmethyltransferase family protein [Kiloniellaceae bacterium]HIP78528.1 isoprenylcysteine carboxylmethyltransferase family protein [Kiloniellaceae bacterium]